MRLLLIAYEFPPSPSPQSLRWAYLARELHALGHEVHVLTADLGGQTPGLPRLPDGVVVHRCFAGPLRGLLAARRKQRERSQGARQENPAAGTGAPQPLRPPRNWKQRISEAVQAAAAFVHFPDIRGEWRPWARRALERLLDDVRPDVVLSSHEPATTLELGLLARRRGLPWVADLGDPVLAGYTPRRWRGRARRLERETCEQADLVTVTNPGAAALLRERHGGIERIEVITQGFDAAWESAERGQGAPADAVFDPDRLELLYSGSLYRFRRIDALLDALKANPRARLNLAAVTVPERILQAAATLPGQLRLLGFLPHASILAMQRRADVLVNIANDDHTQVPGKIYEYLGAGRPILHLGNGADPTAALVERLQRGWVCRSEPGALSALLQTLVSAHARGALYEGMNLDQSPVLEYSWQHIGRRLDSLLRGTVRTSD